MMDGLYAIQRGMDMSLGPKKTLICPAYNDYDLDFFISYIPYSTNLPGDLNNPAAWLTSDMSKSLAAHFHDGSAFTPVYRLTTTEEVAGLAAISKITVRAFFSGRGRACLHWKGHYVYADWTYRGHMPAWQELEIATDPDTGLAWDWEDIICDLSSGLHMAFYIDASAGIELKCLTDDTYPVIAGSESSPVENFGDDPRLYVIGSRCWAIEVSIETADGNTYTLVPDASKYGGAIEQYSYHDELTESDDDTLSLVRVSRNPINTDAGYWLREFLHFMAEDFSYYTDPFELRIQAQEAEWAPGVTPAGIDWTIQASAADNSWQSVCYGNGLFVAVAWSGSGNRVMTSPNGIDWTARSSAADNNWRAVCYGNGLFVAVASTGTNNRVMTSPDGINWTIRTSAADNAWYAVCYGNGLFVAVANSGSGNRVMTSPDGINWTIRTSAADNSWFGVCYGNGLFVAVAATGTGNRVMTSPDGINWTIRTSAADNSWFGVCYGNGLFVAVASTGTNNRVMTSPDGINWTTRTTYLRQYWISVCYGNGLFAAVSTSGNGYRVMTSPDGFDWTDRVSAADNGWISVCFGKGRFVAVANSGTGNRVMTSFPGPIGSMKVAWSLNPTRVDTEGAIISQSFYAKPFVMIEGTRYYGTEITIPRTQAWQEYTHDWATNPATGMGWIGYDISGMWFGVEFRRLSLPPDTTTYFRLRPITLTSLTSGGLAMYTQNTLDANPGVIMGSPYSWTPYSDPSQPLWPFNQCVLPGLAADMHRYEGEGRGWYATKENLYARYTTDFSELPPSFSVIDEVRVSASCRGWTDNGATWRIFLDVSGERYYSDAFEFTNDPRELLEEEVTWATNPATGLAWTYDELQSTRYGMEVNRDEKHDHVTFRPASLGAEIDYYEIAGPTKATYRKVAINVVPSLVKNTNSPEFKPDELRFTLPIGGWLPEREEVCLIRDGAMVFHGIVWTLDEKTNGEVAVLAFSQSKVLECRYIPKFEYFPHVPRRLSAFTLADMFSDGIPIYPNHGGWTQYQCPHPNYYLIWRETLPPYVHSYLVSASEIAAVFTGIHLIEGVDSNLGLFFLLNSMAAYGASPADRLYGMAGIARNRAKFLTNHNPATSPWTEIEITKGIHYDDDDPGITMSPDLIGSVRRLRLGDPDDLELDECAYDGDDILLPNAIGGYMVLIDHALETFLRPGEDDLADMGLAVPYVFNGSWAKALSDFFTRLGQEVAFRNDLDGYVYMDRGTDLGRDTGLKFVDGKSNATVTKSLRDPVPNAVISNTTVPLISTEWKATQRVWISEIVSSQRSGQDLQEWLDLKRDDDDSTWTIRTLDQHWHLMPGDRVEAQAYASALEIVRARKISISNSGTTITAGKRLVSLSETWGEWRSVRGSTDANTDSIFQKKAIDFGGPSGSQAFTVMAEEYKYGAWKCALTIDWSLWVEDGYTADLPDGLQLVLIATLNGKVVAPGRIMSKGNSGQVVIDITDWCAVSESADSENTIAIELVNGVTPGHFGHKITGSIDQYHRLEAVENA